MLNYGTSAFARQQTRRRWIQPVRLFVTGASVFFCTVNLSLIFAILEVAVRPNYLMRVLFAVAVELVAPLTLGAMLIAAANWVILARLPNKQSALSSKLAFVLVALSAYPVTHLLYCKAMSKIEDKEFFALHASVFDVALPWAAGCIIVALLVRHRQALGWYRMDWLLAGLAWPLTTLGIAEGAQYLEWSWTGRTPWATSTFVICAAICGAVAVPLIAACSFVPIELLERQSGPSAPPLNGGEDLANLLARIEE